ncbi:MAG: hypothetical protein J6575_04665 [Bifidobacterium sp.]|nr:hypothetical protein [Bifidobacterium sp.]
MSISDNKTHNLKRFVHFMYLSGSRPTEKEISELKSEIALWPDNKQQLMQKVLNKRLKWARKSSFKVRTVSIPFLPLLNRQ